MRSTLAISTCLVVLPVSTLSRFASAQVPTASMPMDDEDTPATASGPASGGPIPAEANRPNQSVTTSPPTPSVPSSVLPATPVPAGATRPTPRASDMPSLEDSVSVSSDPIQAPSTLRAGFARVNVLVSEAGSTVYVVPHQEEPDEQRLELAPMKCMTHCTVDLPLGSYTVWVKSAEDAQSHADFELRSSRFIAVAPANQVTRDFGFAAGAVGTLATVLGVALLAEVICESCTSTARNVTGALALGLGLPMTAVGWSLYVIHRDARIEDRVLAQAIGVERRRSSTMHLPGGGVLSAKFSF